MHNREETPLKFGFSQWSKPTPKRLAQLKDISLTVAPLVTAWSESNPFPEPYHSYLSWMVAFSFLALTVFIKLYGEDSQ